MYLTFSPENFYTTCDLLASNDDELKLIIDTYGYPPMWTRANTFETLVHIILEQQVSLASALAALNKLKERLTEITPEALLLLNDDELKSCYFSRQKMSYVRYLAEALRSGTLDLSALENQPDDSVRATLKQFKGIGNWTIDIYLMFVLRRMDIFPIGDLAAVNALKKIKNMPPTSSREVVLDFTKNWQPYRTAATMLLWHFYLSLRVKT
jgi:DNA-3-methyladenine glycosylase II